MLLDVGAMTTGIEKTIEEIEESVGGYADIGMLADGNYIRRSGNGNFFSKHFSKKLFLEVQFPAGAVAAAIAYFAPPILYQNIGENGLTTSVYTQLATGAGSLLSYALVFFPLANKERYNSYFGRVKAAVGYKGVEFLPALLLNSTLLIGSILSNLKLIDLAGLYPSSSDLSLAGVSSWAARIPGGIFGTALSNYIYKHGGSKFVKKVYHSVKNGIGQAAYHTNNVAGNIGQYLTMPFKR